MVSSAALSALFSPLILKTLPPIADGRILRESMPNFPKSTQFLTAAKSSAKDLFPLVQLRTTVPVRGGLIFFPEEAPDDDFGFLPPACTSSAPPSGREQDWAHWPFSPRRIN